MPVHSRWTIPIPSVSLPTWLFGSATGEISNHLALIDSTQPESHKLTFSEYRLWSKRVAAGLQKSGLQPGDRVLVFSANQIFFPVLFMGVLMAGGIFTGANPSFVPRELAFQLSDSDAKFLLAADDSLEVAVEAARQISMSTDRIFLFDNEAFGGTGKSRLGVRNWTDLLLVSAAEAEHFRWWEPEDPKETTCCLNYSSGTTGVPKGVEITHYNYVANNSQVIYNASLHPDAKAITAKAKWLCFLPMYHVMGQTNFITVGPKRGIPVYIMPKFDFTQMLENIQRYRITQLDLVPPIVVQMIKSPATRGYDLGSVTHVASGAAPLGSDVSKEFESLWPTGQVNMKQGWGMTEATCTLMAWDPRKTSRSSSVGELMANCAAKVVEADADDDDDGATEVPQGARGELWVRAPNTMKGYWRNSLATAGMFSGDGWMKTGDIGYVDMDGLFFIVDRKKELIKVKGHQVAPAELEAVLLDHVLVADAAVVGVRVRVRVTAGGEEEDEERPRAYVVLKPAAPAPGTRTRTPTGTRTPTAKGLDQKLVQWMARRVAPHKRLSGGLAFVDHIPRNPSGKILRKLLSEQAKHEVGDKDKEIPSAKL